MIQPAPTLDTPLSPRSTSEPALRLRGRWLLFVRSVWLVLAAGMLADCLNGTLVHAALAQTVCTQGRSACGFYVLPTPDNARALHQMGLPLEVYDAVSTALLVVVSLVYLAFGALIFWRKSREWYGLFVSLVLVLVGGTFTNPTETFISSVFGPLTLPFQVFLQVTALVKWLGVPVFLLAFPSGRFAPRWTWALVLLWLAQYGFYSLPAPYTAPYWPAALFAAEVLLVWGSPVAVQVYRYRRLYTPVQRQQTKWVVFGIAVGVLVSVLAGLLGEAVPGLNAPDSPYQLMEPTVTILNYLLVAAAIGIALLRYRLWDIDIIVNRTLVYGALTAGVVGIYVLVVGYLGTALRTGSNLLISLMATGLVAVLFQPLRSWLQRGVNRLMFGQRDDPYGVLARLDTRLALAIPAETVLPTIVETVASALKLPYAAITLAPREPVDPVPGTDDLVPTAVHGNPPLGTTPAALMRLPLVYGHETVGYLLLAPRPGETAFSRPDRHLLDELAAHAGVVVHAVRLTSDLQHARERLVTAREEERRRLRRDLHDGLGPQLASLTLTLGAAREYVSRDPAAADALLADLGTHVQSAIADVRRLIYALRPPALDDLGLVAALREQAARYSHGGMEVRVEASPALAPLPAAIEVAAYRVCLEALANVARHAHARRCVIRLSLDHELTVEVVDDGIGIAPDAMAGVGLRSMGERAEELGGSFVVEPTPEGGTRVHARWPLLEA